MRQPENVVSKRSNEESLEWCCSRHPKRDRKGESRMPDEIRETLGRERKHAIKAINAQVSSGQQAKKRGRHPKYGPPGGRGGRRHPETFRIRWQSPSQGALAPLAAVFGEGP